MPNSISHDLTGVCLAGDASQQSANRLTRFGVGRPPRTPQRREHSIESRPVLGCGQPMPSRQQVGACILQSLLLVAEEFQGKFAVQLRVVDASAFQLSVLVMFHQVVIWVAGKSQRIESECIHRRPAQ